MDHRSSAPAVALAAAEAAPAGLPAAEAAAEETAVEVADSRAAAEEGLTADFPDRRLDADAAGAAA
jgi:hypothetical protein